jgi:large subunit ribosomal protein L32
MALPKKQLSKSKQRSRAAHYKTEGLTVSDCPRCHRPKRAHHVCPNCGYYAGRAVLKLGSEE